MNDRRAFVGRAVSPSAPGMLGDGVQLGGLSARRRSLWFDKLPHMQPDGLSRQEYKVLVEQSPVLIWRANLSTECDYFNDRWLQFRGRSVEQEMGNGWAEGVHPDDLEVCLKTYLGAFSRREVFEMYYRLKRYDGQYRWIFDRGSPYFSEDGEFKGYIGSCIDVTQRIEAQKAMDEARERELANLRGLLRICMLCKRICNADGSWDQLESYIASHSRADFTHGVCPDCLREQMAQAAGR